MPALDRLWAPWRSALLAQKPGKRCIFCAARRAPRRRDRGQYVVARGRHVFALLNLYPYNNGHFMIAPYRHVGRWTALRPQEWTECLTLGQRLTRRLERTLHPHAFNVGFNLGRAAGAGIAGHLHLHVVPRWHGDTNFLPILGGTKVISQSLDAVYELLAARPERSR